MRRRILPALIATGLLGIAGPAQATPSTCAGLPAAILAANAAPGPDVIDLPAGATCRYAAPLPAATEELTIDGHGARLRPAAGASIVLLSADGTQRPGALFTLTAANVTISGATAAIATDEANAAFDHADVHDNDVGADVYRGTATATDSRLARNGTGLAGGGLGFARATDSRLIDNGTGITAGQDVGVTGSVVAGNHIGVDAGENANVSTSRVRGNDTGLTAGSFVGVSTSRVTRNDQAFQSQFVSIDQSVVARNAQVGGGIYANASRSTFFANGAPLSSIAGAFVTNSTFARGEGLDLGNGEVRFSTITGTLRATYSLTVSASIVLDCDGAFDAAPSGATNVSPDADCPDRAVTADPRLRALRDNGGPTPTIGLLPSSSALDVVPTAACSPPTDQRGLPRPGGIRCDAGAYEVQDGETSGYEAAPVP